ncbi:hypothetical protein LRP88_05907 [Fusarium phalaenopsidis]
MKVALALSALLAFPLPIMGFVPFFNNKNKDHPLVRASKTKITIRPFGLFEKKKGPKVTSGPGGRVTIMRVITDMAITMVITRHIAMDMMKPIVMDMDIMRLTVTDTARVIAMVIIKSIATAIAKITAMDMTKCTTASTENLTITGTARLIMAITTRLPTTGMAYHAAHLVQTSLCRQNSTCWDHIREAIYRLEYGLDLFDKYVDHTTLDKCFTRAEEAVVTKCYIHYAQSVIRLLKVTHESGRYLEGEVDRPILTAINSLRAADRAFVLDLGRRIESKESLKVIMRKQGAEDGTTGDSVQEAFNRFISTPLITGEDFKNYPSEAEERARKVEHYASTVVIRIMAMMVVTPRLFLMFERERMAIIMFTTMAIIMARREVITMVIITATRRVTMSFMGTRMSMARDTSTVIATGIRKAIIRAIARVTATIMEEENIRQHRIHDDVEDTVERWQGSEDMSSPYSYYREKARNERLPPQYRNRGEQYAADKLREDRGGHGHRDRDSHYDGDKHHGKFDDDENIDYFFDELDDGDAPPYPKSEHNGRLHDDHRHQNTPYHHQEEYKFGDRKYG